MSVYVLCFVRRFWSSSHVRLCLPRYISFYLQFLLLRSEVHHHLPLDPRRTYHTQAIFCFTIVLYKYVLYISFFFFIRCSRPAFSLEIVSFHFIFSSLLQHHISKAFWRRESSLFKVYSFHLSVIVGLLEKCKLFFVTVKLIFPLNIFLCFQDASRSCHSNSWCNVLFTFAVFRYPTAKIFILWYLFEYCVVDLDCTLSVIFSWLVRLLLHGCLTGGLWMGAYIRDSTSIAKLSLYLSKRLRYDHCNAHRSQLLGSFSFVSIRKLFFRSFHLLVRRWVSHLSKLQMCYGEVYM